MFVRHGARALEHSFDSHQATVLMIDFPELLPYSRGGGVQKIACHHIYGKGEHI